METEEIKNKIIEIIDKVEDDWILAQILKFAENMTKEEQQLVEIYSKKCAGFIYNIIYTLIRNGDMDNE